MTIFSFVFSFLQEKYGKDLKVLVFLCLLILRQNKKTPLNEWVSKIFFKLIF
jgi:hypothetical protein